jgi:hypothetical protein
VCASSAATHCARQLQEPRAPTAAAMRRWRHDAPTTTMLTASAFLERRSGSKLQRQQCDECDRSASSSSGCHPRANCCSRLNSATSSSERRQRRARIGLQRQVRAQRRRTVQCRLQERRAPTAAAERRRRLGARRCCLQAHSSSDAAATAPAGSNGSPRASADCCGSAAEGGRLPHAPRERGPPHCSRGHSSQRAVACASASQQDATVRRRHTHTRRPRRRSSTGERADVDPKPSVTGSSV